MGYTGKESLEWSEALECMGLCDHFWEAAGIFLVMI